MDYGKEFRKYAIKHHGISGTKVDQYIDSSMQAPQDMTRTVIEERQMPFREVDVFSRLMADRIIFLGTGIDDYLANVIQAQLLFLESSDAKRDIQIYINSPGGSVIAGLGIYDTMQYIAPDVATICTGLAASMGSILLCAGTKGKRTCLKHSRIMIHQPSGGMQGQFSDMEISYKLIKDLRNELYEIYVEHTGQKFDDVEAACLRDNWMTANEAKAWGLVDEVLERKAK